MKRMNVKLLIAAIVASCIVATGLVEADDFDLRGISIGTGIGNTETHGLGVYGRILSMEMPERVLVWNPSDDIIADSDTTEWKWDDDLSFFLLFSGHLDNSSLFPGTYEIEVMYSGGTSDLRRIEVPSHLFCSAVPTGFKISDWWLPSGGDILQPTFAWDPFQSPEFDADSEYLTYAVEVGTYTGPEEVICWRGTLSGSVTQVDYNSDGLAAPGYETLPPGSYDAFLFAEEHQDYLSNCLNVDDEYDTSRGSLEKISFTIDTDIDVEIDIKPGSCPNPLNLNVKGVLALAVLGTEDFDVTQIDPASVKLSREGVGEGVSPLRWSYDDVATPFEGELCDCHTLGPDGYIDLTLKFNVPELVDDLELNEVAGETIPLILTGNLLEEFDGIPISGGDCVMVLK